MAGWGGNEEADFEFDRKCETDNATPINNILLVHNNNVRQRIRFRSRGEHRAHLI